MNKEIIVLEKRIEKLRAALLDIANCCDSDNPYLPYQIDHTDSCIDTAKDALKEDDLLNT